MDLDRVNRSYWWCSQVCTDKYMMSLAVPEYLQHTRELGAKVDQSEHSLTAARDLQATEIMPLAPARMFGCAMRYSLPL